MNNDSYSPDITDIYNVMSMLYPDGNPAYPNSSYYLDSFLQEYNTDKYDIFYIIHDKDVDEDGVLIKPHIHLAVRRRTGGTFSLKRYINTLHVSIVNCHHIDNFNAYLQYVLHLTEKSIEDGKYQYPLSELWSNFDPLPLLCNKDNDKYKTDFAITSEIFEYLKSVHFDWDKAFYYAGEKGYYKVFKNNLKVLERLAYYYVRK